MQLDRLAITLGLVASIAGRSNEASDLESSKFVQDEGHVEMNHVIEPADDKHDTQTSRGPGGYTDDKETWSCITVSCLPSIFFMMAATKNRKSLPRKAI
jgi:hypothetical protein